jgi:hypothetical protein
MTSVSLGAATGLRSQLGVATVVARSDPSLPSMSRHPWIRRLVLAAAAGELVVDKLPGTPNWDPVAPQADYGHDARFQSGTVGTQQSFAGPFRSAAGSYGDHFRVSSNSAASGRPKRGADTAAFGEEQWS